MRKAENFRQRRLQATAKIQRQEKFPVGQREVTDLVQHVCNALPARHSALQRMKNHSSRLKNRVRSPYQASHVLRASDATDAPRNDNVSKETNMKFKKSAL